MLLPSHEEMVLSHGEMDSQPWGNDFWKTISPWLRIHFPMAGEKVAPDMFKWQFHMDPCTVGPPRPRSSQPNGGESRSGLRFDPSRSRIILDGILDHPG